MDRSQETIENNRTPWWALGLAVGATTATILLLINKRRVEKNEDPLNWLSRCDSAIKNLESRVHIVR